MAEMFNFSTFGKRKRRKRVIEDSKSSIWKLKNRSRSRKAFISMLLTNGREPQ